MERPASFTRQLTSGRIGAGAALIRAITGGSSHTHHGEASEKEYSAAVEEARTLAWESSKDSDELDFGGKSTADVLRMLDVDAKQGLTNAEVDKRIASIGKNEMDKDPPTPLWKLFLEQFKDALVVMLLVSAIVSAALGEYPAAVSIIVIVMGNAILGVLQEHRAGSALDALASLAAPRANVLRNGKVEEIDSVFLVPGDIVVMDTGKSVPADMRLIETIDATCGEAPLTGEAEPVKKNASWIASAEDVARKRAKMSAAHKDHNKKKEEQKKEAKEEKKDGKKQEEKEEALTLTNMAYMGCTLYTGRAKGVVVKTGMRTKSGEIARLLKAAAQEQEESPLTKKLESLGLKLGFISLCISIIVFVIGVTTGRGTNPSDSNPRWLQMLLVAVSLTVAAVPEGLPTCVTVTLAIGMQRMVAKQALVRNLQAVETLGAATVVCSDKTGTLTEGVMTAVRLWFADHLYTISGGGYNPEGEITPVDLASNAPRGKNGIHTLPIAVGVLCSNAQLEYDAEKKAWDCKGNMSERPIIVAGVKAGVEAEKIQPVFPRLAENPFDSARKSMSVLVDARNPQNWGQMYPILASHPFAVCLKGAPNVVLARCKYTVGPDGVTLKELTAQDKERIMQTVDNLSEQAFRVLAYAYRGFDEQPPNDRDILEADLVLCGLTAAIDPERAAVKGSIADAHKAGIRVVMITGDYVKTAKAIAVNIGLLTKDEPDNKAIDCEIVRNLGNQIESLQQQQEAEAEPVRKAEFKAQEEAVWKKVDEITAFTDVYARAKPVDKITIVRSLQRQGNVCSMTGDGVNDAPALKKANIGVAMGITGSDTAKAAASMVLCDDNFCTIIKAIEEGRTIYSNIQKFVFYLLSTNSAEVLTILIAVLLGMQSPLLPIQILWLNLVTDGAPAIALAMELAEPGIMDEGPRLQDEPLIEGVMGLGIAIQTLLLTGCCLCVYISGVYWETGVWDGKLDVLPVDYNHRMARARTMTILFIVFAELLRAYSSRSLRNSVFQMGLFSNKVMQYSVFSAAGLTVAICFIPGLKDIFSLRGIELEGRQWGLVFGLAFVPFTADELMKCIYRFTGFGKRKLATNLQKVAKVHVTNQYTPLEGPAAAPAQVAVAVA